MPSAFRLRPEPALQPVRRSFSEGGSSPSGGGTLAIRPPRVPIQSSDFRVRRSAFRSRGSVPTSPGQYQYPQPDPCRHPLRACCPNRSHECRSLLAGDSWSKPLAYVARSPASRLLQRGEFADVAFGRHALNNCDEPRHRANKVPMSPTPTAAPGGGRCAWRETPAAGTIEIPRRWVGRSRPPA